MTVNRNARPIAAANKYAGTSNQTLTWFISTYHGKEMRRATPIVIANAMVIPRVSLFRIRWKNSWNTKYMRRMIGAYAQPCHVRATAPMQNAAMRL